MKNKGSELAREIIAEWRREKEWKELAKRIKENREKEQKEKELENKEVR